MSGILTSLAGSRTYLIAFALAACGFYEAIDAFTNSAFTYDLPDVPAFVYALLGAGGAASLRASVPPK